MLTNKIIQGLVLVCNFPLIFTKYLSVVPLLLLKFISPFSLNLDLLLFFFKTCLSCLGRHACVCSDSQMVPPLKNPSPQLLFFSILFLFQQRRMVMIDCFVVQIITIQSKLLHFGILSKPVHNQSSRPDWQFLQSNCLIPVNFTFWDIFDKQPDQISVRFWLNWSNQSVRF